MIRYCVFLIAGLALGACSNSYSTGASSTVNTAPPVDQNTMAYFQEDIGATILFNVDDSTLTSQARTILGQQAAWLTRNGTVTALIEGHADEQGTREYNVALGEARAAAVKEFLVFNGIAASRLRTVSYGKEKPLAVCSEESCYTQNRRAVTVVSAGAGV